MSATHKTVQERRRQVLNIVVQEFTKTAQPVGSNTIVNNYQIGVSAATIRNDLAALEEEGLLTHPHTSAGRIPTDAGYRIFVQNLLATDTPLPLTERKQIRTEFRLARREIDQWLRVSTSVLARAARGAALATAPRALRSRFKHVELVGIQDNKILLVLVLQEGAVKQQLLDLDEPMAQSELSRVSNELNDKLHGVSAEEIAAKFQNFESNDVYVLLGAQVALLIAETMERIDRRVGSPIYRDGLSHMLDANNEFSVNASLRKIVGVMEQRPLLEEIADEYLGKENVQVVIAGDGRYHELQDIGLVIGSYGVTNEVTGVLGVLGPTRMSYSRTISVVRFVAALMSEIVEDLYGYPARPSIQ